MAILFRPVGLKELALLWDSGFREFPPRLPQQPYFYPVTNYEYAKQIAHDWNVNDETSVFSGFVTRFEVADSNLSRYRPHVVGSSVHEEYWIPAKELFQFNRGIQGRITVETAFFGANYEGYVPARGALKKKPALEQFIELAKVWEFNSVEFVSEVLLNQKAIYLNSWFWAQHDYSRRGIGLNEKRLMFERLGCAWQNNQIEIPWPTEELDRALSLNSNEDGGAPSRWRNAMSRAGGRVDNVDIEERLAVQEDFREGVQAEITKRPLEVTVVAVGLFLYAALNLTLVILAFAMPEVIRSGDSTLNMELGAGISLLIPIETGLAITLGIGLWNIKRWARHTLFFFVGLDLLFSFLGRHRLTVVGAVGIVVRIAMIAFLSSKRASAAFETSIQPDP